MEGMEQVKGEKNPRCVSAETTPYSECDITRCRMCALRNIKKITKGLRW